MDFNPVPEKYRFAASGDPRSVRDLLMRFEKIGNKDPVKPWMVKALKTFSAVNTIERWHGNEKERLSALFSEVESYSRRLEAAVCAAVDRGGVYLEPSNIRTGRDGYPWGPKPKNSNILKSLGLVHLETGDILRPEILRKIGIDSGDSVSERWYFSDDPQYPGWFFHQGTPVPFFWLVDQRPVEVFGEAHLQQFGEAKGMIMKDLDAAQPHSWQVHLGIEEGYEVQSMPDGTGFFLGIREVSDPARRRDLIRNVRTLLLNRDPRVIRLLEPEEGIETPPALAGGLDSFVRKLVDDIHDEMTVAELVEYLLLQGINVVDLTGFGIDRHGRIDPSLCLVQVIHPSRGDRIVTRQASPHALFGDIAGHGPSAIGWYKEFKGTAVGPRYDSIPTGDQNWGIADNFFGKRPRKGKVLTSRVREALWAVKKNRGWRRLEVGDYSHHGDEFPVDLGEGVRKLRVHNEDQYATLKMMIRPGCSLLLRRSGQHSAFAVSSGAVRIKDLRGKVVLDHLGLEWGWDGRTDRSDEAIVLANQGDLIIESIGENEAVLYDSVRPVPGILLPEAEAFSSGGSA